jgi:hypothetical protein
MIKTTKKDGYFILLFLFFSIKKINQFGFEGNMKDIN